MEKIIGELKYFNKKFPREALRKAVNMEEEVKETLLEELDKIISSPEIATCNEDYMLHIYSLYLLAQFKEKRAFEKIIDLISLPADEVECILGDTITEDLSSILYSTFDGDLNLIKTTIENSSLNIYARGSLLDLYGRLYSDGLVDKKECIVYLRELIYDKAYDIDSDIANDVHVIVIDRHIFEMIEDIQYLYDENRIDTYIFGGYDDFIDSIFSYEHEKEQVRYIDDSLEEISWWACFEETKDDEREIRIKMEEFEKLIDKENKLKEDAIKKSKKIGRNHTCPCGSGKKYKRCCLDKEYIFLESLEEQEIWLKYYPSEEANSKDGEIKISNIYDKESINIDRLVYLALHHRPIPIWIQRNKDQEEKVMISYLIRAFEKFLYKCKKEEISSFSQYDEKYKIHYRSKEWIEKLNSLIDENGQEYIYEDILKSTNETISRFS